MKVWLARVSGLLALTVILTLAVGFSLFSFFPETRLAGEAQQYLAFLNDEIIVDKFVGESRNIR